MTIAIRPNKAGVIFGAIVGGWHLLWSLLVVLGLAQLILDFIFWMLFIKPVYVVEPFNAGTAAVLVITTAIIGYVVGWLFGALWNRVHK